MPGHAKNPNRVESVGHNRKHRKPARAQELVVNPYRATYQPDDPIHSNTFLFGARGVNVPRLESDSWWLGVTPAGFTAYAASRSFKDEKLRKDNT